MESHIFRSRHPGVEAPAAPVHEIILAAAGARGEATALVDAVSGRALTYAELGAGIRGVASGLAARGFTKGDVFAIHAPNLPEWPVAAYGAMAVGGVVTASSPLYTVDELTYQLTESDARFVVTIPPLVDLVRAAAGRAGCEEVFVFGTAEGATPFASLVVEGEPAPAVDVGIEDLATMPFSSGTTGLPKPVMITHRAIATNIVQTRAFVPTTPDSVVLGCLPMFHAMGQTLAMGSALSAGAKLVTLARFELEAFLEAIQDHRVTQVYVVPPIMNALARHPSVDRYDLSSLEIVGCGAAPLSPEIEARVADRLGCLVGQGYGMTEATATVSCPPFDEIRHGASGRLLPDVEARIVDPESGRDLDTGERGELWVRGSQVFSGYRGHPSETAATIDSDGWLHTGDIAFFDDEGWLYIADRIKELIKVNGSQVAPAELEALLMSQPAVADAAVIGRPDAESGEVPVAYVVAAGEMDAGDLIAAIGEKVAPHKRIRDVVVVDEIPRSPAGKVLRRVLRAMDGAPV